MEFDIASLRHWVLTTEAVPRVTGFHLAVAFVLALLILGQGISAPFVKDAEPQSAQWIADIAHNGHWLVALDYYGFANPKPPLFYWLSAIVTQISGGHLDEVRARAVSLLAGAALATLVLGWTAATLGSATGWFAFVFLLGSYAFASRATTALTDMLMTFLLLASYCAIYPVLDENPSWTRIAIVGALLGLAILTKGPIAILLLALAVLIFFLFLQRTPFGMLRRSWSWAMFAIAVAIAAAWYIPAFASGSHNRVEGTFASENLGHFIPASIGGTGEAARPVYYILIRLLGGVLPLTPLLLGLILMFMRNEMALTARKPLLYQLAMMLAVLLLFTAASAKRDDYILPAIPPLAILFASLFTCINDPIDCRSSTTTIRDVISGAIALAAIIVVLGGIALWMRGAGIGIIGLDLQSSDSSYFTIVEHGFARQRGAFVIFEMAYAIGGVVTLIGIVSRKPVRTGGGLAILTLAGTLLWTGIIRPEQARTHTLAYFAREVRALPNVSPVYAARLEPELSWYYGSAIWPLPRAIWRYGNPSLRPIFLIADAGDLGRLAPMIRKQLKPILRWNVLSASGPPTLYELPPTAHDSLNPFQGAAK